MSLFCLKDALNQVSELHGKGGGIMQIQLNTKTFLISVLLIMNIINIISNRKIINIEKKNQKCLK